MENRKRKRPEREFGLAYMIGAAVILILIVIGIVVGVNSCGKKEEEAAVTETASIEMSQPETEAPTLSEEELAALKAEEEKAAADTAKEAELASYGEFGLCMVEEGYLNVRQEPNANATIIGKLYSHSACSIEEESDGWYLISSGGFKGYVKSDYIETGDYAKELAKDYFKERAVITTEVLWIRKEPSTDADAVGAARKNERYEILNQENGWIQIEEGYISADYVEVRDCLNEARLYNEKQALLKYYNRIGISNADTYVNIRKEPSKTAEIIGKLPGDAGADILSEKDGWYEIKSGAVSGWVNSEFILTGKDAWARAVDKSTLMAIVATDGDGLNVRSGPGQEYDAWTSISNKERYPVLDQENGWVKIDLGDTDEDGNETVAYVSSQYVTVREGLNEAVKFSVSEIRNSLRQKIINYAVQFCGNPYVWGGTSLTKGCDCSGFTMQVLRNFGISLPHYSGDQAKMGSKVTTATMKPGDLLFYANKGGTINHVAMYIGNGQIVHAANRRSGIKISNYNYRTPVAIRNVIGD